MRSIEYWRQRALQRETAYQEGMRPVIAEIRRVYERAFGNIERELRAMERQISIKGGLDALPEGELGAYIARQTRLEGIQGVINDEIREIYTREMEASTEAYTRVMREGYSRTLYDLQRGSGLAYAFNALPEKAIENALRATWLNHNYSTSVWRNTRRLGEQAFEIINAGFVSGIGTDPMAIQLREVMGVGQFAAERLVRTETNYFANQGELAAYKESGVEWYRYLATLDLRTSKLCRDLDGRRFKVSEAVVGENYPPMHPFCRSTTIVSPEGETLEGLERRARDPVTGKLMTVPAGMDYKAWHEEYVESNPGDNKVLLREGIPDGIMSSGSEGMIEDRSAGGLRRSPFNVLSEKDIEHLKGEISAIDADVSVFRFNQGRRTGYMDSKDIIDVMGDVFSDSNSTHPRDLMSERAVLAHEYYGHRANRGTLLLPNSWNDEFRASYSAAKNAPNLSDEDGMYLIMDAIERAKEAGVSIRYNEFMRRCLYGY